MKAPITNFFIIAPTILKKQFYPGDYKVIPRKYRNNSPNVAGVTLASGNGEIFDRGYDSEAIHREIGSLSTRSPSYITHRQKLFCNTLHSHKKVIIYHHKNKTGRV
jgi:hypothetical protein